MVKNAVVAICLVFGPLLLMIGLYFIVLGLAERGDAASTYVVAFQRAGELCQHFSEAYDSPEQLVLDVEDGKPLSCEPSKPASPAEAKPRPLPGVSEAQIDDVLALAENLGHADGPLTDVAKKQIQQRVYEIVALIPPAAHPFYGQPLRGGRRAGIGLTMVVTCIGLIITATRMIK